MQPQAETAPTQAECETSLEADRQVAILATLAEQRLLPSPVDTLEWLGAQLTEMLNKIEC